MSDDHSPAPTSLAGHAAPSSNQEYTPAPTSAAAISDLERLVEARLRLAGLAELLGPDELASLELCAHGLVRGRDVYGALNVATDTRDMRSEAIQELRDTMVYAAAGLLRLHRRAP